MRFGGSERPFRGTYTVVHKNQARNLIFFSPLRMRADLNNLVDLGASEFFSAKKNRSPFIFLKVRRLGSQVHQKLFKSARILSGEKNLELGTPIEIATWRQQDQALWGLWSGPCLP